MIYQFCRALLMNRCNSLKMEPQPRSHSPTHTCGDHHHATRGTEKRPGDPRRVPADAVGDAGARSEADAGRTGRERAPVRFRWRFRIPPPLDGIGPCCIALHRRRTFTFRGRKRRGRGTKVDIGGGRQDRDAGRGFGANARSAEAAATRTPLPRLSFGK